MTANPALSTTSAKGVTCCGVRGAAWLAPAGAGIFAGAALLKLMPPALSTLGGLALLWAAGGLGTMMLAGTLAARSGRRWIGRAAGLGVGLHSLVEGVAVGTGYRMSITGGIAVTVGLMVHLIPESLALWQLLGTTARSTRRVLMATGIPWVLVVAGVAGSQMVAPNPGSASVARASALAAGALLLLAGLSWRQSGRSPLRNILAGVLGILAVAVLSPG